MQPLFDAEDGLSGLPVVREDFQWIAGGAGGFSIYIKIQLSYPTGLLESVKR